MFAAYELLPPAECGLVDSCLQNTIPTAMNTNIPWWLIALIPCSLMVFLSFEGIRSSLRTALILFSVEVCIVLALALLIVFQGGAHGLSAKPLNPGASPH